jgi:tubulin-specific chaperone D
MDDDVTEAKLYGTFEKHDEFRTAQKSLLEVDLAREPTTEEDQHEASLLRKLGYIV